MFKTAVSVISSLPLIRHCFEFRHSNFVFHRWNGVRRRFVRARPGSVLILVVALLVLMAIIGTAFMSMAQNDRVTSVQHENNTEIDILLDGVVNVVKGLLVSDVNGNSKFRDGLNYNDNLLTGYNAVSGLGVDYSTANSFLPPTTPESLGTPLLASRIPELMFELSPGGINGIISGDNPPMWRFITQPIIGSQFSSPLPPAFINGATTTKFTIPSSNPLDFQNAPYAYTSRTSTPAVNMALVPTVYPNTQFPAFADDRAPSSIVVAADTDGDGIADAGLVKLPISSINGLTYYAAVRIVDNNAAVNANVAWQHNPMSQAGILKYTLPQLPGDFFPSGIDLGEMLVGNEKQAGFQNLNAIKFGLGGNSPPPSLIAPLGALDDTLAQRGDFNYQTALEASWMGAGRKLKDPGYWSINGAASQFSPLSINESITLAHNFVIADPTTVSSSILETWLPQSFNGRTAPYIPGDPVNGENAWYAQNFSYLNSYQTSPPPNLPTVPIRSLVTAENGVSNFAPTKFTDMGIYYSETSPPSPVPSGGYQFGDVVTSFDTISGVALPHKYVCINQNQATTIRPGPPPGTVVPPGMTAKTSLAWLYDNDTWIYEPWTSSPTKTSINTATFGQLWLAYYEVMADQKRAGTGGLSTTDRSWAPAWPTDWTQSNSLAANRLTGRMFRSPLRQKPSATTPFLTSTQVMQLRAALAAVNTIDMRDTDNEVTSRTVHLIDPLNTGLPDVIATVYGMERQPFITQVYCNNLQYVDNSGKAPITHSGFIAIELYNPYPVPIDLTNYTLAYTTRADTSTSLASLNMTFTAISWAGAPGTPPVIPANGSIVLLSSANPPPQITLPQNLLRAPAKPDPKAGTTTNYYVLDNLAPATATAMGSELYLFRGRREDNPGAPSPFAFVPNGIATGPSPQNTGTAGTSLWTTYNEGSAAAPNPADMVPVDSYDFTGFPLAPATLPDKATEWYYVRPNPMGVPIPNASGLKAWHFVYPGHYVIPAPDYVNDTSVQSRFSDGTNARLGLGNALSNLTTGAPNLNTAKPTQYPVNTIPLGVIGQDLSKPNQYNLQAGVANQLYDDVPLELNNLDFGGPNGARNDSPVLEQDSNSHPAFPFGGFARNGDVLEVPYVGSYRLMYQPLKGTPQIIEMNPATMDSVMALGSAQLKWGEGTPDNVAVSSTNLTDKNGANPIYVTSGSGDNLAIEQIGRFCPLGPTDFPTGSTPTYTPQPNDYLLPMPPALGSTVETNTQWMYHWATRLFDYLTVQSPQQDLLPDIDPASSEGTAPSPISTPAPPFPFKYTQVTTGNGFNAEVVANVNGTVVNGEPGNPASQTEEAVPVQGLININTAPWRVLAAVPWVPASASAGNRQLDNASIALSIAFYRDVNELDWNGTNWASAGHPHGPFKNIFELNNVPIRVTLNGSDFPPGSPSSYVAFRNVLDRFGAAVVSPGAGPYNADQGNLSAAYNVDPNPAVGDFKSQYMMINRVSNLITTRSDYFTVYVLLQGWREAETPSATLAVQRRAAFFVDRSAVTPSNPTPKITQIPTN